MTWPFENDTSAITKKLARRNVSANRTFCLFNVLTIALAISLIVGISLFQQGNKISEQKILNQMQQATIGGLTAEQIDVLQKEPDLEDIVPYKHSNSFLVDKVKLEAVYMPNGSGIIKSYELTAGTYPERYNEIVIDKNVQSELGYQLNIGDTLIFPTDDEITEEFIITGFADNAETGTFYFYVSSEYAEQGVLLSDVPYSALIRINNAVDMGIVDFENTVYRQAQSHDINRNQIYFNSKFCSSLISGSGIGGILLAALFIAISSGIVIYSVFYLSVSNRVSQIGQLKTIGMTEKQIKRMIRKEGYRFCLFGIPVGIVIGIIFAYLLEPQGMTIINTVATSIIVMILGVIIVQISVHKPAQIAANISPIEAAKYAGNTSKVKERKVRNRKKLIHLSPYSLAVLGEENDRKKHNLTIASLAIGGILFMIGTTFISSWNPDAFTRMGNLENGEYYIALNHNTLVNPKPYGISEYQVDTPFSQELIAELQHIPEIKDIHIAKRTAAIIEYENTELEIPIIPITPDNQAEIMKTLSPEWTYEALKEQGAMVILGTSTQEEIYHTCPSVGETVTLRWFDGTEHSTAISIAGTSNKSMNEGFYLTEETIKELWGNMDLTASLTLSVPEYEKNGEAVESKLNEILSKHPELVMETLREEKATAASTIHNISVQVYGVAAFVILFSIFNLTNTLINRISARRKEFGMLESIGMTRGQIKKMLLYESVLLIIPNLIITVVAGGLAGYLLVQILSANGLTYFQYAFPLTPLMIYGFCLVAISIAISSACLKIQCRDSLVERIKTVD